MKRTRFRIIYSGFWEDPYEQNDLAAQYPDVLNRLVAELDAIPKVEPLTMGQRTPDFASPGSPGATVPDSRPPVAEPLC